MSNSEISDSARKALVERIVKALDVATVLDVQLLAARDHGVQSMRIASEELRQGYEDLLTPEALAAIEQVNQDLIRELSDACDAGQLTRVFQEEYGHALGIEELEQIAEYHESPLGQKDVAASHLATAHMCGSFIRMHQSVAPQLHRTHRKRIEAILSGLG